jgi:thioredoxin-like negative regulator of GroEL
MQSFVRVVNDEIYEKVIEDSNGKTIVLLFTDRKTTAPIFKSLSKTYKDKMVFAEVKKDPELQRKFGVTEIPTLLVVKDEHSYVGETYPVADIKID